MLRKCRPWNILINKILKTDFTIKYNWLIIFQNWMPQATGLNYCCGLSTIWKHLFGWNKTLINYKFLIWKLEIDFLRGINLIQDSFFSIENNGSLLCNCVRDGKKNSDRTFFAASLLLLWFYKFVRYGMMNAHK